MTGLRCETFTGTLVLAAGLMLTGCTDPASDEYVGGLIEMTDADYIAWTGFPKDAVTSVGSRTLDGGRSESRVEFDSARVIPAQITAAPALQCTAADKRSVVSSRIDPPQEPDLAIPGIRIMTTVCQ